MQRITNFWNAFWESLKPSLSVVSIVEKFSWFTPLLAFAGLSQEGWREQLLHWWPLIVAVPLLYLIWKAAVAWERTAGPVVGVDKPTTHEANGLIELPVRNLGPNSVTAFAYMTAVTDKNDSRCSDIAKALLLWRGHKHGEGVDLFGTFSATISILSRHRDGSNIGLNLSFFGTGVNSHPLVPPCPLGQQDEIRVSVWIVFLDPVTRDRLTDKTVRLAIAPHSTSQFGYSVRLLS